MARFCSLFSGSSGNCTYIGTPQSGILIDAGTSAKRIESALSDIDVDIGSIRAVFITHEHSDHVSALRVLASRHDIPVYTRRGTAEVLRESGVLNDRVRVNIIDGDTMIDDMRVASFTTSHDCRDSCGYTVEMPCGRKIAVATDLGYISDEVESALRGCDLVMIESNHDVRMLQNGRYPYPLKRRILSDSGHLSNTGCASVLPKLCDSGTTRFVLGHLSRENNVPQLAFQTAVSELETNGMKQGGDYLLSVASQVNDGGVTVF